MAHWQDISYLIAAILFIVGIKRLATVRSARQGNFLAALGMFIAVLTTLANRLEYELILVGILCGAAIGASMALRVQMTGMPQMVALLNGFGGISSLLIASAEFLRSPLVELDASITTGLSIVIGGVTFSGSLIAFGKLQGLVTEKSVIFRGQHLLNALLILLSLILIALLCLDAATLTVLFTQMDFYFLQAFSANELLLTLILLALVLGVFVVIPIGGADMPVVISLLNSYSGIAATSTGFVLGNKVLIITGALVGASGIILTRIMCVSMNRSLMNVLLGGFGNVTGAAMPTAGGKEVVVKQVGVEEAAMVFDTASSAIIVPGYGMAVAQAQHVVHELGELLNTRNCSVKYAIHPVAGRMPGHMNVLLAEANVPYEILYEMDAVNDEFANTDIALVIGANDVTNPAARHDQSSPIYGMPILNVDKARTVIVVKRSLKPGYAGIDNELYGYPNCLMYLGDAKDAIAKLISEIKANA